MLKKIKAGVKVGMKASIFYLFLFLIIFGQLVSPQVVEAANYNFTQASWSGGLTSNSANHGSNQTGWSQYGGGSDVVTGTSVTINPTAKTVTDDGTLSSTNGMTTPTGGGFSNGTNSSTSVSGSGAAASVALSLIGTGGAITFSGGNTIHTFTSNGTFTPAGAGNISALVVAGGGGGGIQWAGGGGAGGIFYSSSYAVTKQPYTVTIGAGGAGSTSNTVKGSNGSNTVFGTITALGGGGGASQMNNSGGAGGSGGGGPAGANGYAGGAATQPGSSSGGSGFAGGNSGGSPTTSGGGGGAGGLGNNPPNGTTGGAGGIGLAYSISGSSVYYAGGGGGCGNGCGANGGAGGLGGGGAAGGTTGVSGTANTGGGGGAAATTGGAGGSGIAIVSYSTPALNPGTFTSAVVDFKAASTFTNLSFNKTTGAGTGITLDVRAGNTASPDGTWTAWRSNISSGGNISSLSGNRYFQYRANFTTTDITIVPTLSDVTINTTNWVFVDDGTTTINPAVGAPSGGTFASGTKLNTAIGGSGSAASVTLLNNSPTGTGGTINFAGGNTIHTFTSNGTFVPYSTGNVAVMVVAGGGAGGASASASGGAGGGGAGGLVKHTAYPVVGGNSYPVTVGAGGTGVVNGSGNNGGDSAFGGTITALGGGGGGGVSSGGAASNGKNGGSGGGGGATTSNGGLATQTNSGGGTGYGFAGYGPDSVLTGGGGGGAGGGTSGVNGGPGHDDLISGILATYAVGGGGGYPANGVTAPTNGSGGAGTYNLPGSPGIYGKAGIVFVSYPTIISYAPSGTFTSAVVDLNAKADFNTLSFTKTTPTNTNVTVDIRAGNTATPDGTWSSWVTNVATGASVVTLSGNRYFQYRANLSTSDSSVTPTLDSLTLNYSQYVGGSLISSTYDSNDATNLISKISWVANNTSVTETVKFQMRSSSDGITWSQWCGPSIACDGTDYFMETENGVALTVGHPLKSGNDDRYLQYKAVLASAGGVSPALTSVTVQYVVNAAPTFNVDYPATGEGGVSAVQNASSASPDFGKINISYSAKDIDTDTGSSTPNQMVPSFEYSLDGGSTWTAVPSGDLAVGDTSIKTILKDSFTTYNATWDVKTTIPNTETSNAKIRVSVNDGEAANNIGKATSENFALDTKAPTGGGITFDAGLAGVANSATVNITKPTDISAVQYLISDTTSQTDPQDTGWVNISSNTTIPWTFDSDIEVKSLKVQFKDTLGNISTEQTVATPEPIAPSYFMVQDTSNLSSSSYNMYVGWQTAEASGFGSYKLEYSTSSDNSNYTNYNTIAGSIFNDVTSNYYVHRFLDGTKFYRYRIAVVGTNGTTSVRSVNYITSKPDGVQNYGEGGGGSVATASKVENVVVAQNPNRTVTTTYKLTDVSLVKKTNPVYEAALFYNLGITIPNNALSGGSLTVSDASKLKSSGYIMVNNEVLKYASKTGNTLGGVTRGTWPTDISSGRETRTNMIFFPGTPVWVFAEGTPATVPNDTIAIGQDNTINWNTLNETTLMGQTYTNVPIRVVVHDNQDVTEGPLSTQNDYSENGILGTLDLTSPKISFSTDSGSGLESITPALFTVNLDYAYALDASVNYTVTGTAVGGGVDYTLANGTVTIPAGQTTADISAAIVNHNLIRANKTIIVTLSNPTNATLGTNTVYTYTIINHDTDIVPPVVTLMGDNPIHVLSGTTFTDPGATALDDVDGDLTSAIVVTGLPNMNLPSATPYVVTYTATDGSNNSGSATRDVFVDDANSVTYNITATAGANGTISPAGITPVTIHTSQTYTITPDEGYQVATLTVDGVGLAPANTYTFSNVIATHTINVTFTNTPDTTKPVITVIGDNPMNVVLGSSFIDPGVTALDDVDGDLTLAVLTTGVVNANAIATYTITYTVSDAAKNVATATRTVNVKYADTYDITATAGANGTISPDGVTAVPSTTSQAYTITPAENYKISSLIVDGVNLATDTTYTFTNVVASHTIAVTFAPIDSLPPVITILGDNPMNIDSGTTFTDPGATAVTAVTEESVPVVTTGTVDTNIGGTYTITYTATDANGNVATATRTVNVKDVTPPVISNIATPVVTSTQVAIVWDTNEPASSKVRYGTATGVYDKETDLISTLMTKHLAAISDLTEKTQYYYVVVSADAAGNTATSDEQTFTTSESKVVVIGGGGGAMGVAQSVYDALLAQNEAYKAKFGIDTSVPTLSNIEISGITPFSATVSFDTSKETIAFIYYGKDTNYGLITADDVSAKSHKIKLSGLTLGTLYNFKIKAVDNLDNFANSDNQTLTTKFLTESLDELKNIDNVEQFQAEIEKTIESILPSLVPPFINKPTISDITENSATINFKTNVKAYSIANYTLDSTYDPKKENPYDGEVSDSSEKSVDHTLVLTGLKPNTKYHVMAKAFSIPKVIGKSEDITFITKAAKIQGSVIDLKKDSFTVVWQTEEPASSIVEYKNVKTGKISRLTDDAKNKSHSVKIENLSPGTLYQVDISGLDEKGNLIEAGSSLNVKTSIDVTPPVITNVKVESTLILERTDKVQTIISWQTDEPSTSTVYYEEGSGAVDKPLANKQENKDLTNNHVVILTSLKSGTVYRFNVESVDDANNLAKTPIRTIITPKKTESIIDIIFKNFDDTFKFINNVNK